MGDRRFERAYRELEAAHDRAAALRELTDEEVVAALSSASPERDAYLANLLAVEASNRMRRATIVTKHLGEGVIVYDADGRISFANDAVERVLGWQRRDLVGRPVGETVCQGVMDSDMLDVIRSGRPALDAECMLRRADGTTIPALCTRVPVLRDGLATGAVVVFRDITERRRHEESVRASRAQLGLILDTLADGVALMDVEGHVTFANEAATQLLGVSREDLLSSSPLTRAWRAFDLQGRPLDPPEYAGVKALRTGAPVRQQVIVERPDGSRIALETLATPVRDDQGNVTGAVASYRDTSEATARAAIQELLLSGQSDLGESAIVLEGGHLVHANEAFVGLTGYSRRELRAFPSLLHLVDAAHQDEIVRLANASIAGGSTFEVTLRRKDGSSVRTRALAKAVHAGGRDFVVALVRRALEGQQR